MTNTLAQGAAKLIQVANLVQNPQKLLTIIAYGLEGTTKKRIPVRTGNLRRSLHTIVEPHQARLETPTNYAYWVHVGTSRMKGRPFFLWGIEDLQPKIPGLLGEGAKMFFAPFGS